MREGLQCFFKKTNEYIAGKDWKYVSVLKICLVAMGVMIGYQAAVKHRCALRRLAAVALVLTYPFLMVDFVMYMLPKKHDQAG